MRSSASAAVLALLLAACGGGGGGGGSSSPTTCSGGACPAPASNSLTRAEVEAAVSRAAREAQARGVRAHIAVTDRVGNVLAVYSMEGAPASISISSGIGRGGLDGIEAGTLPATLSAIAKAVTGAYLSSSGNAFSTRTASQIVQEHFNPGEAQQPSGPLYGVQFSQLACSDVNRRAAMHGDAGPKSSPLGLSADPGGLPLYKNGVVVGGIGVEADGRYGLDRDIYDIDDAPEERVAVAGTFGLAAPADIRGDRITADGRTFRYVDSESLASDPSHAPATPTGGTYVAVPGYNASATPRAGTAYGTPASGYVADGAPFASLGAFVLVTSAGMPRYAPRDAGGGTAGDLRAAEVTAILEEAYAIARRARAQIRRPLGSFAQVTISVVDADGNILGLIRTPDAPIFGTDVAVQKARTAMFFSSEFAAANLLAVPPASHLVGPVDVPVAQYLADARAFLGDPAAFTGQVAWTPRAIGNLHRPQFPDGIDGEPPGPFSTPLGRWSPFNVGFQLDLVYNQLVKSILGDPAEGCAGSFAAGQTTPPGFTGLQRLRNGAQIFPGGVPIYRNGRLVGGVGVSGDGVDQDDMIAFLGLDRAAARIGNGLGHAPGDRRADRITANGTRLRYVQCPQAPFLDSSEQNVCAGR